MDSTLGDEPFDWTLPFPPRPVYPTILEGSGIKCETKRFDAFYNESGDRVILPSGQTYTSKNTRGYESSLTVTNYWDSNQNLEKTVLEINSPHMKAALKAICPEYATFNINVKNITINGEPRCLFHYQHELSNHEAALKQENEMEASKHIRHLNGYMHEVFMAEIIAFSALDWLTDSEPSLEHKYLWMLFRPGDLVYVRGTNHRAFRFKSMSLSGKAWQLFGYDVDYDGEHFGYTEISYKIESYENLKPLKELSAINMDRLPDDEKQKVKEELVERGKKFVSLYEKRYLWYSGSSAKRPDVLRKSRIMADREGYNNWGYSQQSLSNENPKFKPENALGQMTEVDFMICYHFVAGYSLKENTWDEFEVDCISDITFDPEAFDALILPGAQKKQILSLVRAHQHGNFFDDLISGKGRGMVFLLHGDPGVGKTLTAESVADYCQKPLLRLDAGTLGSSQLSVEEGLEKAFDLAERWHALLLLDEADVYLEQRKTSSLVHNEIVSVFLRMLEYYHGILFLTTNRISSFDTAFTSRIHLAIYYAPLSQPSRHKLLYTFLKKTSNASAEDLSRTGVLDKIAKEQLNGRQIKNLVRIACALALGEDGSTVSSVKRHHLEAALRPMKQFIKTMDRLVSRNGKKQPAINQSEEESEEEQDGDEEQDDERDEEHGDEDLQQSKRRRLA